MRTELCETLGIEHPIVGFTPTEHVAAAISRSGGLGVLGCVRFNDAAELDSVLDWMDGATDGKPYGIDVVMPAKVPTEGSATDLNDLVPAEHRAFVDRTLDELGVPALDELGVPALDEAEGGHAGVLGWLHSVAKEQVEVSLKHRPSLIANALGSPPAEVIEGAHRAGVKVAALAGRAEHARSHVDNGVDLVIAQGHEAGGHTGEIGSMVLLPEIVDAVGDDAVVLAAGGIGSGRQIAAGLALGAAGAWMGSYWLTTEEYRLGSQHMAVAQDAMLSASSSDTVRSCIYSGKPARLLRTRWTEAWSQPGAPDPLPMPLQNLLVAPAHNRIMASNDPSVVAMPVGQIVGRMNAVRPVADVMAELVKETADTLARLRSL